MKGFAMNEAVKREGAEFSRKRSVHDDDAEGANTDACDAYLTALEAPAMYTAQRLLNEKDLFGYVRPGRGRPCHVPTEGSRRFVQNMLAAGFPQGHIAGALGVAINTLKKHYLRSADDAQ